MAEAEWAKELEKALAIAERASQKILAIYQRDDVQVLEKEDKSPVTEADMAAHEAILEELRDAFPEDGLLSEESSEERDFAARRVWVVDPLDGTKEFLARNGEFTVNIALVEKGRPVVGVIVLPAKGERYYAVRGAGAFTGDGARITVSKCKDIGKSRLAVSRSHMTEAEEAVMKACGDVVRAGSSLKGCLVAAGEAEAYYRAGNTHEWDICAMDCIVHEAGGRFTLADGSLREYNQPETLVHGFLASNGALHKELLDALPRKSL